MKESNGELKPTGQPLQEAENQSVEEEEGSDNPLVVYIGAIILAVALVVVIVLALISFLPH
ncbi:MAG TPA: hypothetical protein VH186_04095 [Chloroflexia bacterium]|nr:hypothetical protein [Chloroflexia bacterium]